MVLRHVQATEEADTAAATATTTSTPQIIPPGYQGLVDDFEAENITEAAISLAQRQFDRVFDTIGTHIGLTELIERVENNGLIVELFHYDPTRFVRLYVWTLQDLANFIGCPVEKLDPAGKTDKQSKLKALTGLIPVLKEPLVEYLLTHPESFKAVMNNTTLNNPAESLRLAKLKFPEYSTRFETIYIQCYLSKSESKQPSCIPIPRP